MLFFFSSAGDDDAPVDVPDETPLETPLETLFDARCERRKPPSFPGHVPE